MPVLRYFAYVGGVLVALLLVASWIWPAEPNVSAAQTVSTESSPEQVIRIQSARRWPEKIVFDTNQPTIVPPPALVVANSPPPPPPGMSASTPLDARAQLKPASQPVKRQARARHPTARPDYNGWHDPWRDPWQNSGRHSNAFASAGPPSWSFGRW